MTISHITKALEKVRRSSAYVRKLGAQKGYGIEHSEGRRANKIVDIDTPQLEAEARIM